MAYLAVVEGAQDGTFSAYVPDLPGCVTSGASIEEIKPLILEAIRLHIESLQRHQEPVPPPSALAHLVPA